MQVIEQLEAALGGPLSPAELRFVQWIMQWDIETAEAFVAICMAMYKAGQDEVRSSF